jgi:muconolactone delta-isomerase
MNTSMGSGSWQEGFWNAQTAYPLDNHFDELNTYRFLWFGHRGKETLRMLFFLKASPKKDTQQPLSVEYLEQVVKEWEIVLGYKEEGKVLEVFRFADGTGAFSIWDVDSKDELQKIVFELPMYPFADWDIISLFTAEETLDKAKQALDSMKGSFD